MTSDDSKAAAIFEIAFSEFRDPRSLEVPQGCAGCDERHRLINEYAGKNLSE